MTPTDGTTPTACVFSKYGCAANVGDPQEKHSWLAHAATGRERLEQAEADLRELRHAMVQADIYLANGEPLKAHDELASALAAHAEAGE